MARIIHSSYNLPPGESFGSDDTLKTVIVRRRRVSVDCREISTIRSEQKAE